MPRYCCAVVDNHRLANGLLFGLPVVLDTDSDDITLGDRVLLTYNGEVGTAAALSVVPAHLGSEGIAALCLLLLFTP